MRAALRPPLKPPDDETPVVLEILRVRALDRLRDDCASGAYVRVRADERDRVAGIEVPDRAFAETVRVLRARTRADARGHRCRVQRHVDDDVVHYARRSERESRARLQRPRLSRDRYADAELGARGAR